ncbi:MAG: LytR C-terminal domain-containing protein [Syntrophales bacterium]
MDKRFLFISILIMAFTISGCSGLTKCMDGSYEKEIKELSARNEDLKKELARLDAAVKARDKAAGEKDQTIARLEGEKAALNTQITGMSEELKKCQKPAQATGETDKQKAMKAEAQAAAEKESIKSLRIKILAGNSRLSSARALSSKLTGMGYRIEKVDRAPRSFAATTVFFAADSENEAKNIANKLGAGTAMKPITWSSVYNLIIVVGKK